MPSRASSRSRIRHVLLSSFPLIIGDVLGISAAFLLSAVICVFLGGTDQTLWPTNEVIAVISMYLVIGSFHGLFPASGTSPVQELRNLLVSLGSSFFLTFSLYGFAGVINRTEQIRILVAGLFVLLFSPPIRYLVRKCFARVSWWGEPTVVLGAGRQGMSVYEFLRKTPQRGLKPIGIIDDRPELYWQHSPNDGSVPYLGTTDELVPILRRTGCHWAFAAVAERSTEETLRILTSGSLVPNLVVLHTSIFMPTLWTQSFEAAGLPGFYVRDRLLFPFQRLTKRLVDIGLSAIFLILLTPLILVFAAIILFYSPGPILFRHHGRIGRGGRVFGALKIRTMVLDAQKVLERHLNENQEAMEEWKQNQKLKNDPRIIPGIGQFLRRTSLDELPQLWNVLIGDMSLVGPRPIYDNNEVEKFSEMFPLYLRVRPGLTGLWQVSGRNNTSYEDRIRFDTYYVRNWSLWLDYFILLRTVRTVLMREGSY